MSGFQLTSFVKGHEERAYCQIRVVWQDGFEIPPQEEFEKAMVALLPEAYMELTRRLTVDPSPQHLGTCRRCGKTYNLGTSCGEPHHEARRGDEDRKTAHVGSGEG